MKAIHAINAVLWQPGEQTLKLQTDKPNDYYTRGRPRAPRVITKKDAKSLNSVINGCMLLLLTAATNS